jgi:hypothetical protein
LFNNSSDLKFRQFLQITLNKIIARILSIGIIDVGMKRETLGENDGTYRKNE